jgi:cell division septal protein FtsQ
VGYCCEASSYFVGIFAYKQTGQTALLNWRQDSYNSFAVIANCKEQVHQEKRYMSKKLRKKREQRRKQQKLIWTVSAGLLLIASVLFVLVRNANRINPELIEVQGRPAVKVDQELIDYGYVRLNTNLTFDIKVTNVGDKTLRFSESPYVEVLEGC